MKKATDELLKTHRVLRKVLEGLDVNNKRFPEIIKTLHRTFLAHAWLHDEILLPLLREQSVIETSFLNEIVQEHKDLDRLLKALLDTALDCTDLLESRVLQIRTELESHLKLEAEILYPLANKSVNGEVMNTLGEGMTAHQDEIREVAWN